MPNIPHALALLAASPDISIAAVNKTKTNGHYLHEWNIPNKTAKVDHKQLKENLKKASADIVVGNTQNEYC